MTALPDLKKSGWREPRGGHPRDTHGSRLTMQGAGKDRGL